MGYDGPERRAEAPCDPGDYLTRDQHQAVCTAAETRQWVIKGVTAIAAVMVAIVGWLMANGGFARSTDLQDIKMGQQEMKADIKIIAERQMRFEKIYEHSAMMLKQVEKNGK